MAYLNAAFGPLVVAALAAKRRRLNPRPPRKPRKPPAPPDRDRGIAKMANRRKGGQKLMARSKQRNTPTKWRPGYLKYPGPGLWGPPDKEGRIRARPRPKKPKKPIKPSQPPERLVRGYPISTKELKADKAKKAASPGR